MGRSVRRSQPAITLYDHIRELQMRLLASVSVLVAAGVAVYFIYEPLLTLLRSPLNAPLYYSTPAGSFAFVMKICFMGALVITIPVIIYNLIMFIKPVFEKEVAIKRIYTTAALSLVFAATGAIFAFTCILPGTLHFFAGFQVSGLNALISADSYLNFVTNVIITFIIMFQIPLLIGFIDSIKPLSPKKLLKMEKWVILGSLIIALLVPFTFDVITSLLVALPIVALYNISIAIVVLKHIKLSRKAHAAIIKPSFNPSVASTLSLDELAFNSFADELINQKTPDAPIASPRHTVMDICYTTTKPKPITPVDYIVNQPKLKTFNNHARLISDFNRLPRTNHASA